MLESLEQFEKAKECYDKVLSVKPDHVDALYHSGVLLAKMDFSRAIEYFNRALEIEPRHLQTLYTKKIILETLQQFEKNSKISLDV